MLPTNIAYRTFFIRAAMYGTAFTLDVGDSEYLITAGHLLPDSGDKVELQIFLNKTWLRASTVVIGRGYGEADVAVLRLDTRLTPVGFPVTPSLGHLYVGQDVFFVGFPYKMSIDYGELFAGRPGPFLKKGALSAITFSGPKTLYVDALNNEGFSGGPLYFFRNNNTQNPCIAGIVSKYRVEPEPVVAADGSSTGLNVQYNTGFLVAYDIQIALDLISNSGVVWPQTLPRGSRAAICPKLRSQAVQTGGQARRVARLRRCHTASLHSRRPYIACTRCRWLPALSP